MKYYSITFTLLILSGISISCKKENDIKYEKAMFECLKDSSSWVADETIAYYYSDEDRFSLKGIILESGEPLEWLVLSIKRSDIVINSQDTTFGAALNEFINGVPGALYEVGTDRSADYLLITKIDYDNNIIEGEFSVKLFKFMHENEQIVFSEGKFNLKYINE